MKHTSLFAVAVVTALFTLPTGASAQHTTQKEKAPMKNIVEIAIEAGEDFLAGATDLFDDRVFAHDCSRSILRNRFIQI